MFDQIQHDIPQGSPQKGTVFIEDLKPGMARGVTKTITDADIEAFAALSLDDNPVHLCEDFAKTTIFGGRVAHGMLTAGLFSAIIGGQLPGQGAIYLGQSLKFLAPVRPGDEVRAEVRVSAINRENRRVTLECTAWVGEKAVLTGEAEVLAPSQTID